MQFILLGMSFKTAPISVRDAVAFSREEAASALAELRKHEQISECLILSTCNRTELLVVFSGENTDENFLLTFLAERRSVDPDELRKYIYSHSDGAAVSQLFHVCAGLDSMMLGESQIVSQVKEAYEVCCSVNCNGPFLNRLLNRTFGVSKRIRSVTGISRGSLSVSFAACDLAKRTLGELDDKCAMLIGAGETGQLTARHFTKRGIGRVLIANRTLENAETLAKRFDGEAVPMTDMVKRMTEADVVVTATGATDPVLTPEMIGEVLAKRQKALVLIDLGSPRDIDPAVGELQGAELHNIDDLERLVETNRKQRSAELEQCSNIVDEEVCEFTEWYKKHLASPVIAELHAHFERMRDYEIKPLADKLSTEDYGAVEEATRSMLFKMLRHPTVHLVEAAKQEDADQNMKSVCCILGLHN